MKKGESRFLIIPIGVYRLHVVVTWEASIKKIIQFLKHHHAKVSKNFADEFLENTQDAIGLCMRYSDDNPDLLVWLQDRPRKTSQYGTLYHELYHAVDSIAESRAMEDEVESRAYVFEYLATEANRKLRR